MVELERGVAEGGTIGDDGVSAEIVSMIDEAPVEGVSIGISEEGGVKRYWDYSVGPMHPLHW